MTSSSQEQAKIKAEMVKGLGQVFEEYFSHYLAHHEKALALQDIYDIVIKEVEKPLLTLILQKTSGNQSKTSEILGLNRNTLRKKIKDLGVQLPASKES
jgi:two-component system nitrogen regulation response regulator GlnG